MIKPFLKMLLLYLAIIFLRCDGHPACDNAEDEQNCKDEYLKIGKIFLLYIFLFSFFYYIYFFYYIHLAIGKIKAEATMECEDPYHNSDSTTPTVMTWATICDGKADCYKGIDELDCGFSVGQTLLIGKERV